MKKRRERKMAGMKLLVLLVIVFCAVMLYATAGIKKERDDKRKVKAQVEAQIAEQKEESQKLDVRKEYIKTRKFVEEMARKVLGLVYPDEVLFQENDGENGSE